MEFRHLNWHGRYSITQLKQSLTVSVTRQFQAVNKRNTALLPTLSWRNRQKTNPSLSPPSILVTNLGCLGSTPRWSSSGLSGRLQLHCDWRKHDKFRAMSNQCWFVFLTLKAMCIRYLFHKGRQWMENSTAKFWGDWGKSSGANIQIMAQRLLGPESWQRSGSYVVRCAAAFGFYKDDSHPPPSLLTGLQPLWFFPIPKDGTEAQGAMFWQQWRDPD